MTAYYVHPPTGSKLKAAWLRPYHLREYLKISKSHWDTIIRPVLLRREVSTLPVGKRAYAFNVDEVERALRAEFG